MYITLQNSWVQTRITRHFAQIIADELDTQISIGRVDFQLFNKIKLEGFLMLDRKNDTLIYSDNITARIDTFSLKKRIFCIDELKFTGNSLNIARDSSEGFNFNFLFEAIGDEPADTTSGWSVSCKSFLFDHSGISLHNFSTKDKETIFVDDLNLDVSDFTSANGATKFKINHLNLNEEKSIKLQDFHADVSIANNRINLENCSLATRNSQIEHTSAGVELPVLKNLVRQPLKFNLDIGKSEISFAELGLVIPELSGMNQVVEFSGRIYGDINDIKGRNLKFKTGKNTSAKLNFYINDPGDPDNMYMSFDLKELTTSFADIADIRLPDNADVRYVRFPEAFYDAGLLKFKGNFSGFFSDFVTYGTLQCNMGTLSTDMLVTPAGGGFIHYQGNFSTTRFELGNLFKDADLGKLTFNGSVNGSYNNPQQEMSGVFKGDIAEVDINHYTYRNIKLDGKLLDKMFDGMVTMNDSNLNLSFSGKVDLNQEVPDFDFAMKVNKACLGKLNFSKRFPDSETAFSMKARFSGNMIDNMIGFIDVENGTYKNRNGSVNYGKMMLKTVKTSTVDTLTFISDFLDLKIDGEYQFDDILYEFKKILNHYVPSFAFVPAKDEATNRFRYKIDVKNINALTKVLLPGFEMATPFVLYGRMDTQMNDFELQGNIPGIKYNSLMARDVFIANKAVDSHYSSKFKFGEIQLGEQKLHNFKVESEIRRNVLNNTISWRNYGKPLYSGELHSRAVFSRPDSTDNRIAVAIKGQPSEIFIADTLLALDPFVVTIDSSAIAVDGFNIHNHHQELAINGSSGKAQNDMLEMQVKNFDLKNLDLYLKQNMELKGTINGTLGISNLMKNPAVISDLTISGLSYSSQLFGDVLLKNQWDNNKAVIDSKLRVTKNNRINLDARGTYDPANGKFNFDAIADSISLMVLEPFIEGSLTDYKGYGSGRMNISGTLDKILMNGALMGDGAGLTIEPTRVAYTFNDSVYFKNDTILFDHITIYDDQNNTGIFNGTLVHDNFSNTRYNLRLTSNKIRALNTTVHDNEKFYGVAFASGRMDITGLAKNINLTSFIKTLHGTEINISMGNESEAEQYDFIEFVKKEEPGEKIDFSLEKKKEEASNIDMKFTVEATPEAKVRLIYNSRIGDVIKAQGNGTLVCEMDKDGDLSLSGTYHPISGDYLFTLKNLINKRFTINPGGSITWTGDPYNADIDLTALYKLKASLYDLVVNSYGNLNSSQRIQTECIIHLEDQLSNPAISFDINFPNAETQVKDYLDQFFSTDEDMSRQILFLIVVGKFYTPDYLRGTYDSQNSNMLGTTVSEMFSNQLSNWFSELSDGLDVRVNYRPGNEARQTEDEVELALSKQFFNNRVTLNGNIGNNANQYNTSSSQIVGDFEIGVKLVPSGKLQFKAYNRSNNNLIYETAPYTQGIGISVSEEFNSVNDLLKKLGSLFTLKKKKTVQ